jgi:hypothetical protein
LTSEWKYDIFVSGVLKLLLQSKQILTAGPSSVHTWTKICTQNLNNRSPLK